MKCKSACLIGICTLLIGIMIFKISSGKIDGRDFKSWGDYENPIDQYYLSTILSDMTDDSRINHLKAYRIAWESELTNYLNQYEARCNYESDKKMVRDYLNAVYQYNEQSENFLNSFDVNEETILWFHIQAYRCAFIKHIRGVYSHEWANIINESPAPVTNRFYEEFGGFDNAIDKRFIEVLHTGGNNGIEFRSSQKGFMYSWGTDTDQLFKILFEEIDYDYIVDYQESMYQWTDALNSRFWFTPEELNTVDPDDTNNFNSGMGVGSAISEEKAWIMRLYALQLRTVLKACPEMEVIESVE